MRQDDKRREREEKRSVKREGTRARRRALKRSLETNPDEADLDSFADYGRHSSAVWNGRNRDTKRRLSHDELDARVLKELRGHLLRAEEWADPMDLAEDANGWSLVKSTLDAVDVGRPGLALDRWYDLCSPRKPALSSEASSWTRTETEDEEE